MVRKSDIPEGDGLVAKIDGKRAALYNDRGKIVVLSTICPHARCDVEWNQSAKTWDCPCHGSRFNANGSLLRGPARESLEEIAIEEKDGEIHIK